MIDTHYAHDMRRNAARRILALMVILAAAPPLGATTYYAAPDYITGGGPGSPLSDGLTPGRPFKIADFWDVEPKAGDTLVLLDGEYTGADSMIHPHYSLDLIGRPDAWIRIVAMHEGQVLINGDEDGDGIGDHITCLISAINGDPVDSDNDGAWDVHSVKEYISIEGINVCNSLQSVVLLKATNHCRVRRVCAWNALSTLNTAVFATNYANHNLFEDCAGWGSGRKTFVAYGFAGPGIESHHNTFRRCYGRWEYSERTDYKMTFSMEYWASQTLIENCISTWDAQDGVPTVGQHAFFGHDQHTGVGGHRLLGCIAYLLGDQNATHVRYLFLASLTANFSHENCFAYVDANHPRAPELYPFYITGDGGVNSLRNITSIGGKGVKNGSTLAAVENIFVTDAMDRLPDGSPADDNNISALARPANARNVYYFNNDENWEYYTCPNFAENIVSPDAPLENDPDCPNRVNDMFRTGPMSVGTDPELDVLGRSPLVAFQSPHLRGRGMNGETVGANIWFRYEDGVLTEKPLWPWPMNQRILDAMSVYYNEDPVNRPAPVNVTKTVFELHGGSLPGDYNGDGVLTVGDFAAFTACFSGARSAADFDCSGFDFDQDEDIDLSDYAYFQRLFNELN